MAWKCCAINPSFTRKVMKTEIEYNNDTGSDDEGFYEWWTVTYGDRVFKCDRERDANWLAHLIEQHTPAMRF